MNKLYIIPIVLISAVAMSCTKQSSISYVTSDAVRRDVAKTVTATGALEPVNKVDVGTQVSGIIDKIYVDFNSVVKKGQLLAEMDRTTLIAEVNSAKASLNSAEVELEYQTANYERYKRLHDKGLVSETDYEQAVYSYNKAKLSLEQQKSNMSKINRNLEYATITSPIDGVVLDRAVEEGQTVASGFNTPTLFTIAANLTEMQVIANVDEADIGYIAEGQRASFQVDAFPGQVFEATISQVRINPQTESNVVTYEVVVDAPNPDQLLKPGMTANITIYTQEENDVLSVPMKALRFTPEGMSAAATTSLNEGTVWVLEGESLRPVRVQLGINNGVYYQILGGELKVGDKVVTGTEQKTKMAHGFKARMSSMGPGSAPRGPAGSGAGGPGAGGPGPGAFGFPM